MMINAAIVLMQLCFGGGKAPSALFAVQIRACLLDFVGAKPPSALFAAQIRAYPPA